MRDATTPIRPTVRGFIGRNCRSPTASNVCNMQALCQNPWHMSAACTRCNSTSASMHFTECSMCLQGSVCLYRSHVNQVAARDITLKVLSAGDAMAVTAQQKPQQKKHMLRHDGPQAATISASFAETLVGLWHGSMVGTGCVSTWNRLWTRVIMRVLISAWAFILLMSHSS